MSPLLGSSDSDRKDGGGRTEMNAEYWLVEEPGRDGTGQFVNPAAVKHKDSKAALPPRSPL